VLDEPTTALDVTTQIEVLRSLKSAIAKHRTSAIYVSHDLAVVTQIADEIIVLYNGQIMEKGPVETLIETPEHPYTKRLISALNTMPKNVRPQGPKGTSIDDIVLNVDNVTAGYGRIKNGVPLFPVLRNVSLKVGKGKAIGVIGESGCGKSTLARVISGLLPSSRGNVSLNGELLPTKLEKRSKEHLRKVQIAFQMPDTAVNPQHTVGEIIGRPLSFYKRSRGLDQKKRVEELLELVELAPFFSMRKPSELSGGQKQRVNLARALAAEPDVLLCDEVTSALDTIVARNVVELLKRLKSQLGIGFVFISHDLATVASFADEIVVMYAGRVIESGPVSMVLSPPFHPYTRLLLMSVPELRAGWLERAVASTEAQSAANKSVEIRDSGCPFFDRCPIRIDGTCDKTDAPVQAFENMNPHKIACHAPIEIISKGLHDS
jgi:peptide/nickel transport system ATP-binding protein